jgi:hypothetical protein
MSGGGIDASGSSSNGFYDETSGGSFNNIANYWSWKVDVVLILAIIAINVYFWID